MAHTYSADGYYDTNTVSDLYTNVVREEEAYTTKQKVINDIVETCRKKVMNLRRLKSTSDAFKDSRCQDLEQAKNDVIQAIQRLDNRVDHQTVYAKTTTSPPYPWPSQGGVAIAGCGGTGGTTSGLLANKR